MVSINRGNHIIRACDTFVCTVGVLTPLTEVCKVRIYGLNNNIDDATIVNGVKRFFVISLSGPINIFKMYIPKRIPTVNGRYHIFTNMTVENIKIRREISDKLCKERNRDSRLWMIHRQIPKNTTKNGVDVTWGCKSPNM